MRPWIVPKSAVEPINSNKNKLNNEIIYNFNCNPNICSNYVSLLNGPFASSNSIELREINLDFPTLL